MNAPGYLDASGHKTTWRSFVRADRSRLLAVDIINTIALPVTSHGERPQTPDFHESAGRLAALRKKDIGRILLKRVNERHGLIPGDKFNARMAQW